MGYLKSVNTMEDILVSVVMPAYNCTAYIDAALESALCQEVPLEIIVVNDCSQDDLDAVMAAYADNPAIRYVKNEKNLGVAETRNRGIDLARGKYIAFLDADDIWAKGKLKRQLALMQQEDVVITSTARELMDPDGTLSGYMIPVKTDYSFTDICKQNHLNCSSVVMLAAVAKEFHMHHDDGHEDYLMWLQVLRKYGRGCAINEPLLKYRISNSGKSGNKWNSAKMTYRTYRYIGFNRLQCLYYFLCYMFYGTRKYFRWFVGNMDK